jgi:hypothetical protein
LGASFIDSQWPAIERLSIQASDGPVTIFAGGELDKAEAARHACNPVANHHCGRNSHARTGHKLTQGFIRRAMG